MRTVLVVFQFFGIVYNQMMGYPFDYSSMFQGYNNYNPMSAYSGMGMGMYGNSFGQTGFENLYGGGYGNGMFNGMYNNYGAAANTMNNGLFGTSFGGGQQTFGVPNNNMFGTTGLTNGAMQGVTTNNGVHQGSSLNNGNTMRSYGRRTQNYNYAAPTRTVNNPSSCGIFGCQGGWKAASKS